MVSDDSRGRCPASSMRPCVGLWEAYPACQRIVLGNTIVGSKPRVWQNASASDCIFQIQTAGAWECSRGAACAIPAGGYPPGACRSPLPTGTAQPRNAGSPPRSAGFAGTVNACAKFAKFFPPPSACQIDPRRPRLVRCRD